MKRNENQVVLITGCSSGIGRALAQEFAASGHRVVATARRLESIADLADESTQILELDVTDNNSVENAVKDAVALNGRIDIVVNNAGYALIGPMAEIELDDLRTQLETNVVGAVALILARRMGDSAADKPTGETTGARRTLGSQARIVLVAAALSGFLGLALEVIWFRTLVLVFGSTTYSFCVMLAVFLFD